MFRGLFFALVFLITLLALFFICLTHCLQKKYAVQISTGSANQKFDFYGQSNRDKNSKAKAEKAEQMKRDRTKYLTQPQIEYRSYGIDHQ